MTIDNQPRKLGSGFGPENQFPLYLNEPNKGLINHLAADKMAVIHDWIDNQERGILITNVLDGRILAKIMPDLLVDISLTHLAKILPPLLDDMPEEIKNLFNDEVLLNKLDARFVKSLVKSLPHALPHGLNVESLSDLLSKNTLKNLSNLLSKSLQEMSKVDRDRAYLLGYLIPALLDLMEDTHLEQVSIEIAKRLAPKNFNAVADANYFDLQLTSREHAIKVENNGRTLIFRANVEGSQPSLAKYRGKVWHLDHTHIHLERDGEEREYVLYESKKQKEEVDNHLQKDPNKEIVGEIHTVYKRLPKKYDKLNKDDAFWKYMAVAVPLKIGKFNQDFQDILDKLQTEKKLTEDKKLDVTKNFQEIFLKKFEASSVLYHSWGSLKSETYGFRSGLSFNIIPKSIEISDTQYNRLKELFGTLLALPEKKVLEPIDRKAGRRQARV